MAPIVRDSRLVPPPWLIGMGTLTFGLVAGFGVTALPFLLAKARISVDNIATVSATAMSPAFWAFLVTPIIDVGFTRRAYGFAFGIASAVTLAAALWSFSPDRLSLFTIVMHQDVPESGYSTPVDLGVRGLKCVADSFSGFGERLKIAQHGILNQIGGEKCLLAVQAVSFDAMEAIQNVKDV